FDYLHVSDSTRKYFDRVTDLDTSEDTIGVGTSVEGIDHKISGGTLTKTHFDADLHGIVNGSKLDAGHAVLFTPSQGAYHDHTFLIIGANGHAGYQKGADFVIDVTGIDGILHVSDFVTLAI